MEWYISLSKFRIKIDSYKDTVSNLRKFNNEIELLPRKVAKVNHRWFAKIKYSKLHKESKILFSLEKLILVYLGPI